MSLKPITVYSHARGPNPRKVVIVLEELNVPYEEIIIENPKEESFVAINPNGRVPAIKDPNTGLTLWESGAIVEYIVETYDKENKLNLTSVNDKWHLKQYLHFQMSGQGPYYGQAIWFHKYHSEQVQSAKDRYTEQTIRVFSVLNNILEGKEYLVGNKCTYADISFIPWNFGVINSGSNVLGDVDLEKEYPNFWAWHQRLMERPTVKKAYNLA